MEDREKVERTYLSVGGLLMCTHARSCVIDTTCRVLVGACSGRFIRTIDADKA